MDRSVWKLSLMVLIICLIFGSVNGSSRAASLSLRILNKTSIENLPDFLEANNHYSPAGDRDVNNSHQLFLPFVVVSEPIPTIELVNAWTENLSGDVATIFASEDVVSYHASGTNSDDNVTQASLRWSQDGPCGATTVFSDTVSLDSGEWEHIFTGTTPSCNGVYTNTVYIKNNGFKSELSTQFEVKPPSSVVISSGQAFDRCYLPSLDLMQAWWDNSPYSVFNIYIGGVSFFCIDSQIDSSWLQVASQQGWSFIPTWVGPQAPCTGFNHRMSPNAFVAYYEGRSEAEAAIAAAQDLGMLKDYIIYYDMEGYPNDNACRETVASFLRGWVGRLHELGAKAGVYGSACKSYIADWDENDPKPDDVWIAHWYKEKYDPYASVFGTPCLSDSLWPNHQRLKQYAGDHRETWGGFSLGIDSNVLDGEIYRFPPILPSSNSIEVAQPVVAYSTIRDMALVSTNSGWILVDQNLYWTDDFGTEWRDITPTNRDGGKILAVQFINDHQGWLFKQITLPGGDVELGLLMTNDSGSSWHEMTDNLTDDNNFHIGSASMEFIDDQTGWISVKLQSGSNFSLGRLFATQDGGQSWGERTIPIGEPVRFINPNDGWTAGGPAGDQLYRTVDGGVTWQPVNHPLSDSSKNGRIMVGLPLFDQNQIGYLPITLADGSDSRLKVLISSDGGDTWNVENKVDLNLDLEPAIKLPFSVDNFGIWFAASTSEEKIYSSADIESQARSVTAMGLPPGTVSIDFISDQNGWALVQEGTCKGHKNAYGEAYRTDQEPFVCSQTTRIFATQDAGMSWYDISPSN